MIGVAKPGAGRPSRCTPELAASLRHHFEGAAQEIDRRVTIGERDNMVFPTFSAWRRANGVSNSTFKRWISVNAEFGAAHAFSAQLQRDLAELSRVFGLRFVLREASDGSQPE